MVNVQFSRLHGRTGAAAHGTHLHRHGRTGRTGAAAHGTHLHPPARTDRCGGSWHNLAPIAAQTWSTLGHISISSLPSS